MLRVSIDVCKLHYAITNLLEHCRFNFLFVALTYRSSYSSVIKPYFGMAEDFPHNQYLVSRHKSYAQPRSSLGVYGPENGSIESSYPSAAGLPGGAGSSSGRPLNGYLQQESMSSYRSGSSQPHKPSHYQGDTDGALQSKDAMWGLAPSQKRNWIDAGIVSSYPIEMRSVPQRPSNEHQTQPHDKQEQFSDESSMFQSRPQPRPLPQQPRYEASKPQAQPRPFPQQPRYEASKPQGSEANSPSGGVLQTKSGMWDLADPRSFRPIPVSLRNLYRWPQQQAPIYNRY